jgi:hypothetical protein
MKSFVFLFLIPMLASLIATGAILTVDAQAVEEQTANEAIGVATMKDDGTIVLRLRAKTPQGGLGEGTFVYPPTHPQYQNILSHIGPIRKGETVPVKPWPD